MVKLADTWDLKSPALKSVPVRVRPAAPNAIISPRAPRAEPIGERERLARNNASDCTKPSQASYRLRRFLMLRIQNRRCTHSAPDAIAFLQDDRGERSTTRLKLFEPTEAGVYAEGRRKVSFNALFAEGSRAAESNASDFAFPPTKLRFAGALIFTFSLICLFRR